MNLTTLKAKLDSREGVTLVELLVVILIVTILSVSLLPLLKPFITDAQYAAEPIPVIGNIRTQIGLYYYNHNYLPGMPQMLGDVVTDNMNDSVKLIPTDVNPNSKGDPVGGDSTLNDLTTSLQSFSASENSVKTYYPGIYIKGFEEQKTNDVMLASYDGTNPNDMIKDHFANQLGIDYQDLTGKRVRPNHFQYRCIFGGYKTGAYAYVIGVFGDSTGLPSGTGYAVIEIVNPEAKVKYVGTWKRNKTVAADGGQILMLDNEEAVAYDDKFDGNALGAKDCNFCWLGDPSNYLNSDPAKVAQGITDLETAGWEF